MNSYEEIKNNSSELVTTVTEIIDWEWLNIANKLSIEYLTDVNTCFATYFKRRMCKN